MNQADWDAINEAIQYAPMDIRDKARLAFYGARDSSRYTKELDGTVNVRQLTRLLSSHGHGMAIMEELCFIYGFELVLDDAVQFRLRGQDSLQAQVGRWMHACFQPELYGDITERGDRLLEEVLELLQAHGYDRTRVPTLTEYVYSRPVGDPGQEVGGVMITLAGYCYIADINMQDEGMRELQRIMQPEVMQRIREKQASKRDLHGPLPAAPNSQMLQMVIDRDGGVK